MAAIVGGSERDPDRQLWVSSSSPISGGGWLELSYLTVAFQPLGELGSGQGQQACRSLLGWAAWVTSM
jgi:hypothetical protein